MYKISFLFLSVYLEEKNPKILLTLGYYFRVGRSEQFHQKSTNCEVQRFQVALWY